MHLIEIIYNSFLKYSDLNALKISNKDYSYKFLFKNSIFIANYLKLNNISSVGIIGQRTFSSYCGILGSFFISVPYTPINVNNSKDKIIEIIKSAKIKTFITDIKSYEILKKKIPLEGIFIFPEEIYKSGKFTIDKNLLNNESDIFDISLPNNNSIAYIYFTSGSTGTPKGVQVTHENLRSFLLNMSEHYDLPPRFKASQTFDLSFDPAISDIFFTWMKGGTLCVIPEEDIMLPFDYIQRESINFWNSVPTLGNFMLRLNLLKENVFPSLKYSTFCGEQFPQKLAEAWMIAAPNSSVENLYGPTETTIYISRFKYKKNSKEYRNSIVPIGRPFKEHSVIILDDENQKAPNGTIGQIAFKGPQVSLGYLNDKERTNKSFIKLELDKTGSIWYQTGDLGFVNNEDNLECIGRSDNQIKIAGRRIEIGEIENAMLKSEKLDDIIIVPVKNDSGITVSLIAVTTSSLDKGDEKSIFEKSLEYIDSIFLPKKIEKISHIPTMASGKVNRKKILNDLITSKII